MFWGGGEREWAEDGTDKREVISLFLEFFTFSPVPCVSEKL